MIELKAITSGEIYNIIEYEGSCITDDLYYPKSEADKVIAELKAQKAQAEDDCAFWKNKYNDCKRELDLMKDANAFYNANSTAQ